VGSEAARSIAAIWSLHQRRMRLFRIWASHQPFCSEGLVVLARSCTPEQALVDAAKAVDSDGDTIHAAAAVADALGIYGDYDNRFPRIAHSAPGQQKEAEWVIAHPEWRALFAREEASNG